MYKGKCTGKEKVRVEYYAGGGGGDPPVCNGISDMFTLHGRCQTSRVSTGGELDG